MSIARYNTNTDPISPDAEAYCKCDLSIKVGRAVFAHIELSSRDELTRAFDIGSKTRLILLSILAPS